MPTEQEISNVEAATKTMGKKDDERGKDIEDLEKIADSISKELPAERVDLIMAQERYQAVEAWLRLTMRLRAARITARMTKGIPDAQKFEGQVQTITLDMEHALRGIREIDNEYPRAKKRMLEMIPPDTGI